MRCKACDAKLTDAELNRKYQDSREYVDLCRNCYRHVQSDIYDSHDAFSLEHTKLDSEVLDILGIELPTKDLY